MSDIAIRAEHVFKQYTLGATSQVSNTLRDHLVAGLSALWRRGDGVRTHPETIWALQDVSFDIRCGEIVGIIGHNGAGKSTLLKILSRITELTTGRIEINGRLSSLLEVGTGFHAELTGRENIYLNGAILGMSKQETEQKFDKIVAFSEIGKFIDTPVKHYSSGMYVRLAYAVAAHLEPDILLIDEVLSVGDLAFQRKCMAHAKQLREQNATVLFVSHNMFAIKAMCNRVIYLTGGQVRFDGSPEEVIQLYEADSRLTTAPWAQGTVGAHPSQRPIQITHIELFKEDGTPCTIFDHGERMRIRLEFEASQPVTAANFTVSFIRSDSVPCCNYNMAMDGICLPTLLGKGVVEILTPPLKLISELYTIHIIVWDTQFEHLYSAQTGMTFHVQHDLLSTHFGVFHESAEWFWHMEEETMALLSVEPGVKYP